MQNLWEYLGSAGYENCHDAPMTTLTFCALAVLVLIAVYLIINKKDPRT